MDESLSVERRINLRLLSYWEKLRRGRPMPAHTEINAEDLRDLWDSCFIISVSELSKPDASYHYMGQYIADAYTQGSLKSDASQMVSPKASGASRHFQKVVETGKPLIEEGEFANERSEIVKYRQCLLPLGHGGTVEMIFGGMTFKVYTAN